MWRPRGLGWQGRPLRPLRGLEDLAEDDFRRHSPRFEGENFRRNLELVERVEELAAEKGVAAGQRYANISPLNR